MTEEEKQVASGGNTRQSNLRYCRYGAAESEDCLQWQSFASCQGWQNKTVARTCIITVMVLAGFQPDRIAMGITPGNNIT